jgi:TetR/AcrR family transcriptional regulator, tetracycline repressor protein
VQLLIVLYLYVVQVRRLTCTAYNSQEMVKESRQNVSKRVTLTPQTVVEGGLALAEAEGLAAVTVRRLAKDLDVTPMALYWHFRSKDELLEGMAARIFDEVDLSVEASATWQVQLRALLGSMVGVLRAHPSTAILLSTHTASSEGSLRATEVMLDILGRGGFSPTEATQVARHALSTVTNLVVGEPGVVVRGESEEQTDLRRRARLFLESLPPERYPRLVEAATPLSEGVDPDTYFAFGLDLLLAGIEAMAARKRWG